MDVQAHAYDSVRSWISQRRKAPPDPGHLKDTGFFIRGDLGRGGNRHLLTSHHLLVVSCWFVWLCAFDSIVFQIPGSGAYCKF